MPAVREGAEVPVTADRRAAIGLGYTLATGNLFCDIGAFKEFASELLARPVMTHELADPDVWRELRDAFELEVLCGR